MYPSDAKIVSIAQHYYPTGSEATSNSVFGLIAGAVFQPLRSAEQNPLSESIDAKVS